MTDPIHETRRKCGEKMLTQERLKELLDYDPQTGLFTWRWRKNTRPGWNTQFAGRPAGCTNGRYMTISVCGNRFLGHRLAWFWMTGEWPVPEVDHKNGDGLENRWENLRLATPTQNMGNRKINSNNSSGYKGVYWSPRGKGWAARVTCQRKRYFLGIFDAPAEAHAAYEAKARTLFGDYSRAA